MALIFATTFKNTMLDQIPNPSYLQLHTGAPGTAGTSNVSTITGRKSVAMSAAGSVAKTNSGGNSWDAPNGISGTEDLTHASIWTAASGGDLIAYGTLTTARNGRTTDDTITIAAGDIDFAITD